MLLLRLSLVCRSTLLCPLLSWRMPSAVRFTGQALRSQVDEASIRAPIEAAMAKKVNRPRTLRWQQPCLALALTSRFC